MFVKFVSTKNITHHKRLNSLMVGRLNVNMLCGEVQEKYVICYLGEFTKNPNPDSFIVIRKSLLVYIKRVTSFSGFSNFGLVSKTVNMFIEITFS